LTWLEGPIRYLHVILTPILLLIVWFFIAGAIYFVASILLERVMRFQFIFIVIAWSELIRVLGEIIKSLLILSKGTTYGVTMSLALFLPLESFQNPSLLHNMLDEIDLFNIWQLMLWAIGASVLCRMRIRQSMKIVFSVWLAWIIINILFIKNSFLDIIV
jgi:hypothetical protein